MAMTIRKAAMASAVAVALGFGGAAVAQRPTGQEVNPSPMPPGSKAGNAPGMNSTGAAAARGAPTAQANPTPMPPGSTAGNAPGMNHGSVPGNTAQNQATPGGPADRGQIGGTGAQAPSGQPDVARGTAQATPPREGAATGATTPNRGSTSADPTPPAATTQHTAPRTAAAPVAGANSFTEGQARSRISDAGFTDVQGLQKDDQGIWRGHAMRNGQPTGVALDYQGNVVATPR